MKPLGKAVKVALDTNKPVQEAVDDLLIDYRSTPHPATGIALGDMLFRGGYHSRFPKRPPVTEQHIKEAKKRDKERKTEANAKQNSSRWRQYPNINQGNEVPVMRFTGKTKFKSFYEKTPYIVTDVKGTQYTLLSCDTKRPRQPIIRHASQIKLYQQPAQTMPPHYRPAQTEPQQSNKAYDLPSNTRRRNNQRNATQNEPPAYPASNSQVPNEVDMPPPLPGPIISVFARIFEKIVHDQLYNFLSTNNILTPSQSAFRKLHSTITSLINCTDSWYRNIDKKQLNLSLFLDLKKAFDTVDHQIMVKKLNAIGVRGIAGDWFASYLSNRKQYCSLGDQKSSESFVTCGIPQGSCLGPLLFIIYRVSQKKVPPFDWKYE